MGVAKATITRIVSWYHNHHLIYQLTLMMLFVNAANAGIDCPRQCKCFSVLPNDMFDPPTYSRVQRRTSSTLTAVSCQRQQLKYVPKGFPPDTALIFLTYNRLTYLNRSMFAGLKMIQSLDVSHNKLTSIENDTFDDMNRLEQLDISYNLIRQLPNGFLGPWYKDGVAAKENDIRGDERLKARTQLRLLMGQNPWHCNCRLQTFLEDFSCVYDQSPCVQFYSNRHGPIGECSSPKSLRGVFIARLSSFEDENDVNVCKMRHSHVDIPLLVTMFSWMGISLGYVIYYILRNQKETANHRSYLSTLHRRKQSEPTPSKPRSSAQERPLTANSALVRESRTSEKTLPEQYEMKPLQKGKPTTVRMNEQRLVDVWVERSDSDVSVNGDDYELRSHPRINTVLPYQFRRPALSWSSDPSCLNTERKDSDVHHHMSRL